MSLWTDRALALVILLPVGALAGCFDSPDAGSDALTGPGIRSTSTFDDEISCSPVLYIQSGCVAIRIPEAHSQCVGGTVEGYIDCAVTLHWNATVGSIPGELRFTLEGHDDLTSTCDAANSCVIPGNLTLEHAFSGTGLTKEWILEMEAFLEPEAGGLSADWFRLKVTLLLES